VVVALNIQIRVEAPAERQGFAFLAASVSSWLAVP
jgi:hypothetical protein